MKITGASPVATTATITKNATKAEDKAAKAEGKADAKAQTTTAAPVATWSGSITPSLLDSLVAGPTSGAATAAPLNKDLAAAMFKLRDYLVEAGAAAAIKATSAPASTSTSATLAPGPGEATPAKTRPAQVAPTPVSVPASPVAVTPAPAGAPPADAEQVVAAPAPAEIEPLPIADLAAEEVESRDEDEIAPAPSVAAPIASPVDAATVIAPVPTRVAAAGRSPLRDFIDSMIAVRAQERELREAEQSGAATTVAGVTAGASAEMRTRAAATIVERAYAVVAEGKAPKDGKALGLLKA